MSYYNSDSDVYQSMEETSIYRRERWHKRRRNKKSLQDEVSKSEEYVEENRKKNASRIRQRRAMLTSSERKNEYQRNARRAAQLRAGESEEELNARRRKNAERAALKRAMETLEEANERRRKKRGTERSETCDGVGGRQVHKKSTERRTSEKMESAKKANMEASLESESFIHIAVPDIEIHEFEGSVDSLEF